MTDEDDDEEFEPLEVVPVPVSIVAHDPDVGGSSVVRLFFRAGAYGWPGGGISDVLAIETWDRVSIGLLRREVEGEAPDGTMYGESLAMGGDVSLDVALSRSLGTRKLLDASTGEFVPRVERPSGDPLPSEAKGTPRWRWSWHCLARPLSTPLVTRTSDASACGALLLTPAMGTAACQQESAASREDRH